MYAIAGGKGGCGKTTTVCGLARALVRAGHRPVLVDADVDMPDLHDRVGASPEPGLDALAAGHPLEAVLQRDHALAGVDVVPSGTASTPGPALDRLVGLDRPILIDCAAGAGADVAAALGSAESAVVVSTDTRASLEDAAKTAAMSRALDTPVACLCLREPPGGSGTSGQDDRLRRLVDAPAVVRIPSGNAPDSAGERPSARERERPPVPSASCRTGGAGPYDRLAVAVVDNAGVSGGQRVATR